MIHNHRNEIIAYCERRANPHDLGQSDIAMSPFWWIDLVFSLSLPRNGISTFYHLYLLARHVPAEASSSSKIINWLLRRCSGAYGKWYGWEWITYKKRKTNEKGWKRLRTEDLLEPKARRIFVDSLNLSTLAHHNRSHSRQILHLR